MEPRRGRRPAHGSPAWRRAAVSLALLIAATAAAATTVHRVAPAVTAVHSAPTPAPKNTPQDDVGAFVDPTPSDTPTPGQAVAVVAGTRGPHIDLPVLLYHYIRINPVASDKVGFNLSVTPNNFAQQMAFLHYVGAHTVSLTDALQALRTGHALPPRSLVLTFDDGYMNFATKATPIMLQNGLSGTVFVVSGFLNKNGYMTADQVKQVAAEGMVIGVHTINHVALASVPLSYAQTQIDVSHQQLEALIGKKISDFAYPYGSYDVAVEKLVQQNAFADAVTTDEGVTLSLANPYAWPRWRIGGTDTLPSFAHKALFGMPVAQINALVARFLASPAASPPPPPPPTPTPSSSPASTPPASPSSTAVSAMAPVDTRRYS